MLSHCHVTGLLDLHRAQFDGDLHLHDSRVDGAASIAVNATAAVIAGDLCMQRLAANGQIVLLDAQVSGNLALSAAKLSNANGIALEGSRLSVGGQVFCRDDFTCVGEIGSGGSVLPGSWIFSARTSPTRKAARCSLPGWW